MKIGILFGGASTEHDISIKSGLSILNNIDKSKYIVYPIYIDKNGLYYIYEDNEDFNNLELIENICSYLKNMDVVFPVLHGKYGEDGTIEGLLELLNIPYVGCNILSSSLCMDKVYTKRMLKSAHINVSKSIDLLKSNDKYIYIDNKFNYHYLNSSELINKVNSYLKFPVFVKPSKSGSSIGVNKVNSKDELIKYVNEAFNYDDKALIEEEIIGRELECAVLGNVNIEVSNIGEILKENFYSYDAKYVNSINTLVNPKDIDTKLKNKIRNIAKRAYIVCNCCGLSRVDFFLDENCKIYVNEINTMPGFTNISMYPKLMEDYGYSYQELIDKLINMAIE